MRNGIVWWLLVAGLAGCDSDGDRHATEAGAPDADDADAATDDAGASIRHELTIGAVHAELQNGSLTCRALVQGHLDRIAAIDASGAALNTILETSEDALAQADSLDAALAAQGLVGPLHCVPLLLKDSIATIGPLHTTAGSATMAGTTATRDAYIVERLRSAGAVVLGKCNMDEWALDITGYGSRGGQTLNPYDPSRSPGGSSGGCAAAVSANLALAAVGIDTVGSIRLPAAFDGVVGIRTTYGLASHSGLIPLSPDLDVPGPLARSVTDAAAVLGALAHPDPEDPSTASTVATDYVDLLDAQGLDGARLGVLTSALGVSTAGGNLDVITLFQQAVADLEAEGATIVPGIEVDGDSASAWDATASLVCDAFASGVEAWLSSWAEGAPVQDFAGIVAASEALGAGVVHELETLRWLRDGCPPDPLVLEQARSNQAALAAALETARADATVDAFVFLTLRCPAVPLDPARPDACNHDDFTAAIPLASLSGWAEVTVPAGSSMSGLPVAISFLGPPRSEATLLRLAFAYEQATRHRREPPVSADVD